MTRAGLQLRRPPLPPRLRPGRRGWIAAGLAGLLAAALPAGADQPLRFGFSTEVFQDVNENDARAALKVWAATMGRERGIPVDPDMAILNGAEAIRAAFAAGRVDAVTMTALEFWLIRPKVALGPFVLGRIEGQYTEEYIVLVHRDHPATSLADLRGRSLNLLQGSRASLAAIWLDTALRDLGLGAPADFWSAVTAGTKLTRVVLPVFFRRVDACLVTRRGFRTMAELNPQVGAQLRVIAASPALVPVIFAFSSDLASPERNQLLANLPTIGRTAAGRQTLTLFQTEDLEVRPESDLAATCELLARRAGRPPPAAGTPTP